MKIKYRLFGEIHGPFYRCPQGEQAGPVQKKHRKFATCLGYVPENQVERLVVLDLIESENQP